MLIFRTPAVGLDGLHIDGRAIEILNLIASTSLLDVARKGPLANAPVLDLALRALIVMTGHLRRTPIRLTGHAAEITTARRGQVDAYVMAPGIIDEGTAHAIPKVPSQGLTR